MTNWLKFIKNIIGDFSGDGGAAQDDSVKASLDLAHTELSEILDMARTGADIAVTAAETNLFIDDAPTKIINGIAMRINLSNMGAADTYEFREYYRMTSGGTPICGDPLILSGVQLNPRLSFALEPYRYGCKVTSTKTAGADISFEIEAIREA
jgi:hypothetical protein